VAGYRAALDNPGLTPDAEEDSEMNNILHRNPKMQWGPGGRGRRGAPVTQGLLSG
jgi:hypothetical protein